jgi:hypothetical protein
MTQFYTLGCAPWAGYRHILGRLPTQKSRPNKTGENHVVPRVGFAPTSQCPRGACIKTALRCYKLKNLCL